MRDIDQIKRAHKSAQPKRENPAWCNTHRDLGVVLDELERLEALIDDPFDYTGRYPEVCENCQGHGIVEVCDRCYEIEEIEGMEQ